MTHIVQKDNVPVFNVKLIEPFNIQPLNNVTDEVKIKRKKPPLLKKRRRFHERKDKKPPASIYTKPELDETSKPPDTLYETYMSQSYTKDNENDILSPPFRKEGKEESPSEDDKTYSYNGKTGASPSGDTKLDSYTFLFDRETIEKFAKKPSTDKRGLSFDAPEFRHRGYMRMLKQRIESIWIYPEEAIRQGLSGDLYIKFSIKRDGSLEKVELIRTSGYWSLDKAAMKAIRDAQPFWPLPDDWQKDDLVINGHFIYILGETLVM